MVNRNLLGFVLLVGSLASYGQNNATVAVEVKTRVPDPATGDERNADEWKIFPTRTIASLKGFKPRSASVKTSKHGGDLARKTDAKGFYYTKYIDNRWWLVDPEGYLFIHAAINSVHPGGSDRNKRAFETNFGTTQRWVEETKKMMKVHGFNGLGCWSDVEAFRASPTADTQPVAYTKIWNFMSAYAKKKGVTYVRPGHTGYLNDVIFVFDPEFESFCDEYGKQLVSFKDDKNLLGHFSDNELPFQLRNLDGYLGLPKDEPGYTAAARWLDERKIDRAQITDNHRHEFLAFVADTYFSIVSKAIKKYDPNHLFLGSRFHASERHYEKFLKAAAPWIDVVSINYYRVWTPERDRLKEWKLWLGKPFMVTEYYVKGEDSGLPNKSGAGWLVKTQHDRGLFYQNFNLALLESGICVGWHYFKYQDNDPAQKGAELSNTDSNKGVVDNDYKIYAPMADQMRALHVNMYNLITFFDGLRAKEQLPHHSRERSR